MTDLLSAIEPERHSVGTDRLRPLAPDVTGRAIFGGPLNCYRYLLERLWDAEKLTVLVVMMNPSAADPLLDDSTVAKITKMARCWSWYDVPNAFGRLLVGNTYAYRAKDQSRLIEVEDPIGPDNDQWLRTMDFEASVTIYAYGTPRAPKLRARGPEVVRMLSDAGTVPYALRVTNGRPWHPLYLPDATEPEMWAP